MMRFLMCVMAVAALAACKPNGATTQQANNPQDLQIEIHRYGAMLGQTAQLTENKPGTSMAEPADPKELARTLRETVWRYNVQRSDLCGKNLYVEVSCGPAFEPVWMAEPADAAPSFDELKQRSEAVGAEVQKLWNAICEDARRGVTDAQEKMAVCPME
ncbi:MAG: hypothetical protein QM759_17585 [Terricaulis sp.]